jgi:membrane protease YdiL (CAAX protease family)
MTKLVIRIIGFYLLTFIFSGILGGLQEAVGFGYEWLTLPQLAPGLAALVMLALFRRDGLRLMLGLHDVRPVLLLGALAVPIAMAVLVYILVRPATPALTASAWLMLPGMALGAFGEELGWRGYLHKRLDPALRPLASSALVGVLWALWHVGLYQNGVGYMVSLVILMIAYSTVLYRLLDGTAFNVWVAALFHLGINLANLPFYGMLQETRFIAVNALVWVVAAAALVVMRRDLFVHRSGGEISAPSPVTAPLPRSHADRKVAPEEKNRQG